MVLKSVDPKSAEKPNGAGDFWIRLTIFAVLAVVVITIYAKYGEFLSLEYLAEKESELRDLQQKNPVLVFGAAFLIYVAVTGLSLPGATALSLLYGWYFGFGPAFVLVSFASTLGATIAFLLSRYLFRDAIVTRFGDRLNRFIQSLETEGPFYLFTLRLIPVVPFFVVNAVMGLTPIRTTTYWWVSQLGMLPGTAVYIYAASRVPNLGTLAEHGIQAVLTPAQITQFLLAFILLGIFPLVARWAVKAYQRSRTN